jgi:hypothetical protein
VKQPIIRPEDIAPGLIDYDDLVLDPHAPLTSQLDDLHDDMLLVEYPNGCVLAVSYLPAHKADGRFIVALSQQGPDFVRRSCETLDELRELVVEVAAMARSRPWVPHGLFRPPDVHPGMIGTNLVVDPTRPMSEQLDRLGRDICSIWLGGSLLVTVDWLPEHSPDGQFHVTLKRWELADPPDPTVHLHRTCRTIPELREIIQEVVAPKKLRG